MKNVISGVEITTNHAETLLTPAARGFCMPDCVFAAEVRCRFCGHFDASDAYCWKWRQYTDPQKYGCSAFC